MERISRELMWMQIAQVCAQRSTCMRRNIGAILVSGTRIVSTGYNGAPPGLPHCDGRTCVPPGETGCSRAVHAEANAIARVLPEFDRQNKTLFTTESPCIACAALIAERKVIEVYYLNEYRLDAGIRHLIKRSIPVYRMTPSGMIIRKRLCNDALHESI